MAHAKDRNIFDLFGTLDDVVVEALVRIILHNYYAPVMLETNQVHLKTGTICPLNEEFSLDSDKSETY